MCCFLFEALYTCFLKNDNLFSCYIVQNVSFYLLIILYLIIRHHHSLLIPSYDFGSMTFPSGLSNQLQYLVQDNVPGLDQINTKK